MSVRSLLAGLTVAAGALAPLPLSAPAQASVPPCHNADLTVGYHYTDSGAGHVYGRIVIRNHTDHRCVTGGFGGISYVGDGNGTQIGAAADRVGSWTSYTLLPGQRLVSPIDEVRAGNYPRATCRPVHVDGFRVYVPNATRSQYVPHATTGCLNTGVHLLSHRSYRRP